MVGIVLLKITLEMVCNKYFTLIKSMEITQHGLWNENDTFLGMNYVTSEITPNLV